MEVLHTAPLWEGLTSGEVKFDHSSMSYAYYNYIIIIYSLLHYDIIIIYEYNYYNIIGTLKCSGIRVNLLGTLKCSGSHITNKLLRT